MAKRQPAPPVTNAPAPDRRAKHASEPTWPLIASLAALWGIDALLSLQPANFSPQLVYVTILGNAENQPQPIFGSLVWASRVLAPAHVELNAAIVAIELAIAGGLLWRKSRQLALAASIAWALGVWWLGEGFDGLFAGKATMLVGAPGPALLYALLAIIAWPQQANNAALSRACEGERLPSRTLAGAGVLGEAGALRLWALLWVSGALLRAAPFWFSPTYALVGDLQLGLDEEPRWLAELNMRLSHLAAGGGLALVLAMALVEASVGLLALTRWRRAALGTGITVSTVYWVVGQQLGGLFTGSATDVGAGPLYVLLALALWPRTGESDVATQPGARPSGFQGDRSRPQEQAALGFR